MTFSIRTTTGILLDVDSITYSEWRVFLAIETDAWNYQRCQPLEERVLIGTVRNDSASDCLEAFTKWNYSRGWFDSMNEACEFLLKEFRPCEHPDGESVEGRDDLWICEHCWNFFPRQLWWDELARMNAS